MTARQLLDLHEAGPRDRHDDELGDAVPGGDCERMFGIRIQHCDADLAAVACIHGSRAVHDSDAVTSRQAASRDDERDITVWQGNGNARADSCALARCKFDRLSGLEICAGVTRVCVCRHLPRGDEYINVVGHEVEGSARVCNKTVTNYRERLWPAPWLFIATALVIPATLLVFLPINQQVGIIAAAVLYAGCVIGLLVASPAIAVTDTMLIAGKAKLPLELIGTMTAAAGEAARAERGTRLDARAWLLIRGWIDPVVRIELLDPNDPAPYWLVSSRHPEALISAVQAARSKVSS